MLSDLQELQRLLHKIERNHEKQTVAIRQFHDAAAEAMTTHGETAGLGRDAVAAFTVPKNPK